MNSEVQSAYSLELAQEPPLQLALPKAAESGC